MPSSYNGIGTTYYGKREKAADGSYVTTEFAIFGGVPLWPRRSWRVRKQGQEQFYFGGRTQNYEVLERLPIHWAQVLNVYLATVGIVVAVIVAVKLFGK